MDTMPLQRSSILTVCLVAALVLSGCAGTELSDEQEQDVVERFEKNLSEVDGYHATMKTTVTVDNESVSTTAEVWARPGTGEMRQEIIEPAERAGNLTVSNGSVMWSYNPAEGTATRFDIPNMSADSGLAANLGTLVERSDLVYNGTETLDGTETHKLTLLLNESAETAVETTTTVWLDTDRLFPVKMHSEFDGEVETTVRFTDVELNPGLSDDRFEFDSPEGTEIREQEVPNSTQYDTRTALVDDIDRSLPAPALPDGYTFEQAFVTERDGGESVTMTYANDTEQVTISIAPATDIETTEGESVTVAGTTGQYQQIADVGMVVWTSDDTRYAVTGPFKKETLVDIVDFETVYTSTEGWYSVG